MPDLVIRDYRDEDLPALVELNMRATYPDADGWTSLHNYPDLLNVPERFQRRGAFLVGLVDGEVVAMGAVGPVEAATFELRFMRVAIAHQRRGYAMRLIDALERRVLACGGREIVLDTTEPQVPAQRLYERAGFQETHRSVLENALGTFRLVHYRKTLATPA